MSVAAGTTTTRILPRQHRGRGPFARARRWYRRREQLLLGTLGFVLFFAGWQVASNLHVINALFFSSPIAIVQAGVTLVQTGAFWNDVRVSSIEFVAGFGVAVLVSVPLGIAIGWYRRLSYAADPWLNFLNPLPKIAILPVVILAFGLGIESKIFLVFFGVFIALIIPTIQGVRTVDRSFLDVARSFGASQRRLFTSVVLPSTVPFIITGLRLGISRGLIAVVVSELYAQTTGLGVLIDRAADALRSDRMLFAVFIFSLMGIVGTAAIRVVERRFDRWRPSAQDTEE